MENSTLKSINLHPQPKETKIALVLIYNDIYIVYNRFGQRIGVHSSPDIEHHMVFYNSDEIIVSNNECWVTKYNSTFTEINLSQPQKIDYYFIDQSFKRAHTVLTNLFFNQNEAEIYAFFDILVENWEDLNRLKLTEKYQKENLLDMIAICKIMRFENISEQTFKTFTKRIYQEILLEKNDLANNHFLSVSDIIYDEILQLPIIKSIQSIHWV